MASCSYSQFVGGSCGPSSYNPAITQCILIAKCEKDVKGHLQHYNVGDSSSMTESMLLLARAGIFEVDEKTIYDATICPRHRDQFGIRWRSNKKHCACPPELISHKSVKGDRGVTFAQSLKISQLTQVLVPIASPICRRCRKMLEDLPLPQQTTEEFGIADIEQGKKEMSEGEEEISSPYVSADPDTDDELASASKLSIQGVVEEQRGKLSDLDVLSDTLKRVLTLDEDQSIYVPEESCSASEVESSDSNGNKKQRSLSVQRIKMNEFLMSCTSSTTIGPYKKKWENSSIRTKNNHITKAKDAILATLNVIAPGDAGHLWQALTASHAVEKELNINQETAADKVYLEALAETYENASSWATKRQVLSIMADLVPFNTLKRYIPGLTKYRYTIARKHKVEYGRGVPLPLRKSPRMRVDFIQLDHFLTFITSPHIIQDLPFGQRYLRLSSGKVLETPNVIRAMIPQRIVNQYQQYCHETEFHPFGDRTMLRILSACSATVRKSLQGIDYIAAEGAKAFDNLCEIVERLEECGRLSKQTGDKWKKDLKIGKQYLKSDYKVHVAASSSVEDHCCSYSLTDRKDVSFKTDCDHDHDQVCLHCQQLKDVMQDVNSCLSDDRDQNVSLPMITDEVEDLRFTCNQALQDIQAWKAHQLRSVRQDTARIEALDNLGDTSVLLTQDWAMKFLPQKYRESQADWFAKRGISWHISVVARKQQEKIQSQTFVHIMENCSQDSGTVIRIIEHILSTLKNENPELSKAFLRQDNAGCYHSSAMLGACCHMAAKTGIAVERVDFSDPQGGKGACDRKAATIKAHVRRFINEGHDAETGIEFKEAILSVGGVKGVRVVLVDALDDPRQYDSEVQVKWEGISTLNNFKISEEGITAWRAYNIGSGKLFKGFQKQGDVVLTECGFKNSFPSGSFIESQQDKNVTKAPEDNDESNDLFQCPNNGCINAYPSHSALEHHISYEQCQLFTEKETLLDQAKRLYQIKLIEGSSAQATIEGDVQPSKTATPHIQEGWALKSTKRAARFNDSQKRYLEDKFSIGQETGHKADPAVVAREMRYAKSADGTRLFKASEFLTSQQIQSFFSRKSSKLRHAITEEDIAAVEDAETYVSTRTLVLREVQLCHPIVYDTYNLCEMHNSNKIGQLNVAMLKSICEYFDLDVSNITARRKAPYLNRLNRLIETCDCH